MALHQRQIIREAVKRQLLRKTVAGDRVYETRAVPLRGLELPAIAVFTLQEPVDSASKNTAPRELTRNLQLVIEANVKAGQNVDDAIDAMALEIERAIDADETFGGVASDAVLSNTEMDTDERGDQLIGVLTLTYAVTYFTRPCDSAVPKLADFDRMDVKTNLSGDVLPADESEDSVEIAAAQSELAAELSAPLG